VTEPVRGHLRLIIGSNAVPLASAPIPARTGLDEAVLAAAHAWAEFAMASAEAIDVSTPEGKLRMDLIDAVHDVEHFYPPVAGLRDVVQLDMFDRPPGS
jgi:hypothetical protein